MVDHIDPDRIVLLALNERAGHGEQSDVRALSTLDDSSRAHLQECAVCRGELAGLTRTVELARSAADLGPLVPPVLPASIWTGIATELGIGADAGRAQPIPSPDRSSTDVPAQRSAPAVVDQPPYDAPADLRRPRPAGRSSHPDDRPGAGARQAGDRRAAGWRRGLLVAAVVVAAAVGTAAGVAIGQRTDDRVAAVEYQAELKPMPAGPADAHATATVTQADGSQTLKVNARQLPLRQGYYEVWLYNPTADKMVAVGTLGAAGDGEFTLASTIDLRSYSVVDVSAQDFDGNPVHKTSMLQGPLTQ
jgi:hypothetical protein